LVKSPFDKNLEVSDFSPKSDTLSRGFFESGDSDLGNEMALTPDQEVEFLRGVVNGYISSEETKVQFEPNLEQLSCRYLVSAKWWARWCDYINSEIKSPHEIYEKRKFVGQAPADFNKIDVGNVD